MTEEEQQAPVMEYPATSEEYERLLDLAKTGEEVDILNKMYYRSRPVQQPAPEDVQFSERELIHIDSILTLHAIEHLPKECNCPECVSIHKKIAELRKSGKQGGERE